MDAETVATRRTVEHPGRKPVYVCDECGAKNFVEGFNPDGACEHMRKRIKDHEKLQEEV